MRHSRTGLAIAALSVCLANRSVHADDHFVQHPVTIDWAEGTEPTDWRLFFELSPAYDLGPFVDDRAVPADEESRLESSKTASSLPWHPVPESDTIHVGWIPRMKGFPVPDRYRIIAVQTADPHLTEEMNRRGSESLETIDGVSVSPWIKTRSRAPWYVLERQSTLRIDGIDNDAIRVDLVTGDIKGLPPGDYLFLGGCSALVAAAGLLFVIYRRRSRSRRVEQLATLPT